ncbi:hypothetical protein ACG2LH_12810 [Zhouia sp. PK063]|uniref:hypothetical protein n=1 Tax=Zhouia sp. PK063 TaxID=3373602 RepID=UPI0037B0AC83
MKTFFWLKYLIFTLISITVYAQNDTYPKVSLGPVFKNDEREIPFGYLGKDDGGIYMLYSGGKHGQKDQTLRKFDTSFTPTEQETTLTKEDDNGTYKFISIKKITNFIIHIYSITTAESKKMYYEKIHLKDFSKDAPVLIDEIAANEQLDTENITSVFLYAKEQHQLVFMYAGASDKSDPYTIIIKTFDENFNLQNTAHYELPYSYNEVSLSSFRLNKDGYLLTLFHPERKNYAFAIDKKEYEHVVLSLHNDTITTVATLKPQNHNLRSLKYKLTDDGFLLAYGLYSDDNVYHLKGIYYCKININDRQIVTEEFNELPASFFTDLYRDNAKKKIEKRLAKRKYEAPYYVLEESFLTAGNELILTAEQIHSVMQNFGTTYFYENIGVFKLTSEGTIAWASKIGRDNTKNNTWIYSSYFPVYKNNQLYIIYNGNADNIAKTEGPFHKTFFGAFNAALLATHVDENGHVESTMLVDKKNLEGIRIRPSLTDYTNDNTLLLFGQDIDNLKVQRFIELQF